MPGMLFHVNASAICPHGGQISTASSNTRVLVSGMPVVTLNDVSLVAGCLFTVGSKPQPCVEVQWLMPSTRVLVNGQPALLQTSTGISQSAEQIAQGPPIVTATQTRVSAL